MGDAKTPVQACKDKKLVNERSRREYNEVQSSKRAGLQGAGTGGLYNHPPSARSRRCCNRMPMALVRKIKQLTLKNGFATRPSMDFSADWNPKKTRSIWLST